MAQLSLVFGEGSPADAPVKQHAGRTETEGGYLG